MSRTYIELFEPALPVLGLDFDAPGRILPWLIPDRANGDRTYYKTATLEGALDFIQAQVANGDATADETDLAYWRGWRARLGWSVKVGRARTLSERGVVATSRSEASALVGPGGSPSVEGSSPPRSENVYPLFHDHLDESA